MREVHQRSRGDLSDVIARLKADKDGKALAEVLGLLFARFGDCKAWVSRDQRRAVLAVNGRKPVAVRVAPAKTRPNGLSALFRFKRPADLHSFEAVYLGGMTPEGDACADRFLPGQIASLQTITVRAVPGLRESSI